MYEMGHEWDNRPRDNWKIDQTLACSTSNYLINSRTGLYSADDQRLLVSNKRTRWLQIVNRQKLCQVAPNFRFMFILCLTESLKRENVTENYNYWDICVVLFYTG